MARPLRIEYPNAYYHVCNRGEGRKNIFPGPEYYDVFLTGLADACARLNVEVLSYCILKNEYHLLLKTPEGNLSRFMRQVDGLYTQNFQKLKKSKGSIFRARYKAVLVQAEPYLLPLSRYLHCLPLKQRVGIRDYEWSSYRFFSSRAKAPVWLKRDEILEKFAPGSRPANRYAAYVAEGVDKELSHFYGKKNLLSILGDEKFKKKVQAGSSSDTARGVSRGAIARMRPPVKQVVKTVADHFKVTEDSIYRAARGPGSKNLPRWISMHLCQELSGVTLQVIAQRFGLKRYGTVSTTIGKLKAEVDSAPRVQGSINKLAGQLSPSR
ncbi:MAG: helix-turn-helix domain-containing protein [Pseudomonadales bacterium]|nr:helix-turn-helix domain-containing protein [Pseudomonadales bacterium]